jgi:hypothetical protein
MYNEESRCRSNHPERISQRDRSLFPGDKVWVTVKFADELEASGHAR